MTIDVCVDTSVSVRCNAISTVLQFRCITDASEVPITFQGLIFRL